MARCSGESISRPLNTSFFSCQTTLLVKAPVWILTRNWKHYEIKRGGTFLCKAPLLPGVTTHLNVLGRSCFSLPPLLPGPNHRQCQPQHHAWNQPGRGVSKLHSMFPSRHPQRKERIQPSSCFYPNSTHIGGPALFGGHCCHQGLAFIDRNVQKHLTIAVDLSSGGRIMDRAKSARTARSARFSHP